VQLIRFPLALKPCPLYVSFELMNKKRNLVISHAVRIMPTVDLPVYGSIAAANIPLSDKLLFIALMVLAKFILVVADYTCNNSVN